MDKFSSNLHYLLNPVEQSIRRSKIIQANQVVMSPQSSALHSFLEERQVDGEFCAQLEGFDGDTQSVVSALINVLSPSANALRELILMASEVAIRDKSSLKEVLSTPEIVSLISNVDSQQQSSNRKQLFADIKQCLFARRYPEVARIQSRLAVLQKEIAKSFGVKVELPPGLEGDKLSLNISGRNKADFMRLGQAITELSESSELQEIFSLLKGEDFAA